MSQSTASTDKTIPLPPLSYSSLKKTRRPQSTATVLSKAIQDFEEDFHAWDSSYRLTHLPQPSLPPAVLVQSRPYTPTPYSSAPLYHNNIPTLPPPPTAASGDFSSFIFSAPYNYSAFSTTASSRESLVESLDSDCTVLPNKPAISRTKERVERLGGVHAYNPYFEPGTQFPRRMSRAASVGDSVEFRGSESTLAATARNCSSDTDEEGAGYWRRFKQNILRKFKSGEEDIEGGFL
ncbi:hypothetical protein TWF730_010240 [Orbilia blumenaviensis]|uniref:Uncharacterized protein n=1 Tax=Orbilia blumenaviensis TaxID=1796055 RepID=A0AAV9UMQ0_9PEZI